MALLFSLSGCAMQAVTGATAVPLELKGYSPGQYLSSCPSEYKAESDGDLMFCASDGMTFAGQDVKYIGLMVFRNQVVFITVELDQSSTGFEQKGVLGAFTEKFGPPALGGVYKHVWNNGDAQLQLNEISGTVKLISKSRLPLAQQYQAQRNASDI